MRLRPHRKLTALVLIGSMALLPAQQVLAASPVGASNPDRAAVAPPVRDVSLQAGGVLRGQVVDRQGQPCTGIPTTVIKVGATAEKPVETQTDSQGRFQFEGLSAGVYQVATAEGGSICRLWASNAAPPSTVPAALVVQGEGPVRGNLGGIGPWGWTLIAVGVAAAIAIPLAVQNNKKDGS